MDAVRAAIARHVPAGELLVVGCSFGPDSLALADAALEAGHAALLVYVDHGLRPEAAAEGERVVAFAGRRGARGEIVTVRPSREGGVEAGAREARLAALTAIAERERAPWILLGHTADDQAETILMRLLQGAGPVGLAGIPRRRGRFLRPLLDVTRAEVEAYLVERGLEAVRDPMNDDPRYLRVRLRNELLPALAAVNPRVRESLRRTAEAGAEIKAVLDWAVDEAARGATSASALAALPPLLAKRVLMATVPVRWSARHLQAALALVRGSEGSRSLDLPGGTLHREYDQLRFRPEHPTSVTVDVVGEGGPFEVRRWRPGDRIRLSGGARKLQDAFTDRKVPRRLRAEAVVVVREADGEVVWVEHIGQAFGSGVRVALTRSHIPANSQ